VTVKCPFRQIKLRQQRWHALLKKYASSIYHSVNQTGSQTQALHKRTVVHNYAAVSRNQTSNLYSNTNKGWVADPGVQSSYTLPYIVGWGIKRRIHISPYHKMEGNDSGLAGKSGSGRWKSGLWCGVTCYNGRWFQNNTHREDDKKIKVGRTFWCDQEARSSVPTCFECESTWTPTWQHRSELCRVSSVE